MLNYRYHHYWNFTLTTIKVENKTTPFANFGLINFLKSALASLIQSSCFYESSSNY